MAGDWNGRGIPEAERLLEPENKINFKFRFTNVFWYTLFLLLIGGLVFSLIMVTTNLKNEISLIKESQKEQFTRHVETNQFLLSTISWSSRRENTILFMRDKIFEEWKRIGHKATLDEAFHIADVIAKECESYPHIDPFLILATQYVESSFRRKIRSPAGAIGLNQIMPSTGRILAGHFGYEYSDSLLYDSQVSTRLCLKYMDILYAQYGKWDVCLAEYNGGPFQAHYYSKKKENLSQETKGYVPNVLSRKKYYEDSFSKYRIEDKLGVQVALKGAENKK